MRPEDLRAPTAGIINLCLRTRTNAPDDAVAAMLPVHWDWVLDDRHTGMIPTVCLRWDFIDTLPPPLEPWEYTYTAWLPLWLAHQAALVALDGAVVRKVSETPLSRRFAAWIHRDPMAKPTDLVKSEATVEHDGAWVDLFWSYTWRPTGHRFRVPRLLLIEAFRSIFDLSAAGV